MVPAVGAKAPAFGLPDQDGKNHRLGDYRGKWVLLYFYPKDNTSGCTKEACAIRDEFPRFGKLDAVVLGVSKDSVESHRKFADKHGLPFTLLSDADTSVQRAYGVWRKKKMAGREYMGTVRASFLIDPQGKIAKVYEKVKPAEHAAEVLRDLKKITG
ncbi:MAG TPA: thioredoxin-dependent thiol peroxidase [Candidatus Eisenbacteria bacterium]|uniref:thioredoxin-dependent peroxiredoxin n=1 Tax=Eiseniibacteriota bacterium TaxID=2212470 RepID=A0A7V2ATP0_UNCEI|nr:thioredoxin-dependent thiol peroxidase [Candidatus Eisenbacteria bacterium]